MCLLFFHFPYWHWHIWEHHHFQNYTIYVCINQKLQIKMKWWYLSVGLQHTYTRTGNAMLVICYPLKGYGNEILVCFIWKNLLNYVELTIILRKLFRYFSRYFHSNHPKLAMVRFLLLEDVNEWICNGSSHWYHSSRRFTANPFFRILQK